LMAVFVSSLVIDEIRRIVKESEILKYDWQPSKMWGPRANTRPGRMTQNGLPRIRTAGRSWKSESETTTSRSR
jgi:hypothetical protein